MSCLSLSPLSVSHSQISRDGQRVYDGRNEYELGRGRGDGRINDYRLREGRIPPQDYGRRESHSSETATINFFHDDRVSYTLNYITLFFSITSFHI